MIWYGAADPAAGVDGMPDYYARVQDMVGGPDAARRFARMFPLPGVYHCRSGYVPYEANFLGAIVNWAEVGAAPDSVAASALLPGGRLRHRPIYAYPMHALYRGQGDVNAAASFVGRTPAAPRDDHDEWAGSSR